MKKTYLLLFATTLFVHLTFSQDSKFSTTLGYPIAFGDNFLADHSGVVDLGLQFRFIEAGPVNIGLSANAGYYSRSTDMSRVAFKESVLLIQPCAFGEINSDALQGFRPLIGLGYSFVNSKIKFDGGEQDDASDGSGGLNLNLGTAYDVTDVFFAFVQFDYLNINRDNPNQDTDYFNNTNIIKLGVGLRF